MNCTIFTQAHTYTHLWYHHHNQNVSMSSFQKDRSCTFEVNPTSGPRQLLICLMTYGLVFTFYSNWYKWNHIVGLLLWLLWFGMSFEIHTCSNCISSMSFILLTSILLYEYTLLIYSSDVQHLNISLLLAIINKATMNIHV